MTQATSMARRAKVGWPFGDLTRVLVLAGQRRGEVAGMTSHGIDFMVPTWTTCASRAENGREHKIPLSPQVLAILENLPKASKVAGVATVARRKSKN
jgi:integrase